MVEEFQDAQNGLIDNTIKHSLVLVNVLATILMVHFGLENPGSELANFLEKYEALTMGMIGGWFFITFASVRKLFMTDGLILTYFMFSAFSMIMTLLSMDVVYTEPPTLQVIGLTIAIFSWVASAMYDNVDCLRTGLDEEALAYYRRAKTALNVKLVNGAQDEEA